ncbi:hypothetical protein M0802_015225 [Mischocyttarus mexicanus]|nr:hypothetical protein M0802_015227 [Mischocyttarus mexicanus]KAI4475257.1 hypothetical protein M0802_015225 [Mischocyttarus mexicanus]
MEFMNLLETLWSFYSTTTNAKEIKQYFIKTKYFRFTEVRSATIRYWNNRFATNFCYPQFRPVINSIIGILILECVVHFKKKYPSWTIAHYMDAFKVTGDVAKMYLQKASGIRARKE